MINTKLYRRYRLLFICSICLWAVSLIKASEMNGKVLDLSSFPGVTAYESKVTLLESSTINEQLDNKSNDKRRKTAIGQWASKHRAELAFSGVALGTGITAIVLNSKVKDLKAEEESLYKEFLDAPSGSDFDGLWNDYTEAHDKTQQMRKVRNGFSLATGGITIAVVMSFYIGRP